MSLRALRYMIPLEIVLVTLCFPLWYLLSQLMNLPEEITFDQLIAMETIGILMMIFFGIVIWWTNHRRSSIEDRVRLSARVDERGFFLVLRSFHQTASHETSGGFMGGESNMPTPAKSLLPLLGKALLKIGVPVLIGEPELDDTSESWPGIVVRTTNQNWWRAFSYLTDSCRAIILIPADTPGSMAEMETILHSNLWHKTIIFMPPPIYNELISKYETRVYKNQGGFGAYSDIDKKVLKEKEISWNNLRNRLSQNGIQLPPFEPDCYLYLPNQDFSVRHKTVLTNSGDYGKGKDEILISQLQSAFVTLLASEKLPGIPVKDIFKTLEEIENMPNIGD